MSSRPRISKYPVLVNGNMASASLTSSVTIILDLTQIGYSLSWSGSTPIGTVAVQVSNDYALSSDGRTVTNAGTWTAMTVNYAGNPVQSVPVTGNTGTGFIDIGSTGAYAIRLVYTKTSGTGTLQAIINAKVA